MLDVAACFHAMAQTPACSRSLEKAAGRALTHLDLMRLTALAFLHDIGKANAGFQAKRWSHTDQRAPQGWPAPAGHSSEAMCIFGKAELLNQLPVDEMSNWGAACMSLWRASISHHGRPVEDNIDSLSAKHLWRPVQSAGKEVYNPQATLREIGSPVHARIGLQFCRRQN
jgi:CRISPR-associated endonuclease/helicase Cas3